MTDMTEIAEGQYLNVEIVSNSPTKKVVVMEEGEVETNTNTQGEEYDQLVVPIQIDGKNKKAKLNSISCKGLMEFYETKDTKDLVNKVLRVKVETKGATSYLVYSGTKDDDVVIPKKEEEPNKVIEERV